MNALERTILQNAVAAWDEDVQTASDGTISYGWRTVGQLKPPRLPESDADIVVGTLQYVFGFLEADYTRGVAYYRMTPAGRKGIRE